MGYAGSFGESDLGFDVGANYYWYPGDFPSGYNSPNTLELYAGVTYKVLSAKYWYSTTDLFGIPDSDGSSNLDVAANWEFVPGLTLNAAVGKQWVNNYGDLDYSFWKLGVTKSFESGFSIAAAWNDTDIDGLDEAFTVSISKSF